MESSDIKAGINFLKDRLLSKNGSKKLADLNPKVISDAVLVIQTTGISFDEVAVTQ